MHWRMFSSVPEPHPIDVRSPPQLWWPHMCPNMYTLPLTDRITPTEHHCSVLIRWIRQGFVFLFFFMAEATTIILFKMLPLLIKIQWGQEICTQNTEGLRVRKRKRLCEWGWGITRLDAHIQAKVINEKLRGCERYRGKYILAVEWINWRLLRRKNSLVWRIYNLCNTWKDSTETEYEKTEKGKWFCGFHERSTFLIQDKTGHLIWNQRAEPRVKTSSEQEQGWCWA